MSTILDAIKKSEQERKLTDIPTLSDIPAPQERSRWPIILLVTLLLVALLAIIWLLLRSAPSGAEPLSLIETAANPTASSDLSSGQGLTTVSVNIISYSKDAAQRFVIIDGNMYREGEFVRTGLKVQSIEPDVVVLNDRGELISRRP